ncbi:MAG: IS3 family transposase [Thalassospira sp.]|nr:IS3 family transposase [Thalassospira sp.]
MSCSGTERRKRTQRDYNMGFKLAVVDQVEKGELTYKQAQNRYGIQGRSTVLNWLRKHGKLDWSTTRHSTMSHLQETPEQKIKRLEKELEDERIRVMVLDGMITIMDEEYGAGLRKKYLSEPARTLQAQGKVSLSSSCRCFGLSRQAVYQLLQRRRHRQMHLAPLHDCIARLRRQMPRLGTRKLYHLLADDLCRLGIKLGRDGLFDWLREHRLLIGPRKNYTRTTNSRHWMRNHPNLVTGRAVSRPEQVFVSDITYVESDQGVHYLSLVTDAFSRKIMGYELSTGMRAEQVLRALKQAIRNRVTKAPLIHHSDRGLQYCSAAYQGVLRKHGITPSMTDGYDCYQNALAERVNGILKQEFLFYRCKTFEDLRQLVKEAIDTYNTRRPHLALAMQTPEAVHQKASGMIPLAP